MQNITQVTDFIGQLDQFCRRRDVRRMFDLQAFAFQLGEVFIVCYLQHKSQDFLPKMGADFVG